ncbi:MAG: alpha-mannosidase [Promethearchaeota archaeon]
MLPKKPKYPVGKYSGMERLDPSTLEEPDNDDAEVREIWFTEERNEPEFKKFIKSRIAWYKKNLGLDLSDLDIIAIGHSHIDVCWLWRYEQTRKKAMVTFNKACEIAEKWAPGVYTYHQSQPQLYEWVEEDYPELFERIKKQVKKGSFQIVGGSWVEPDCMMPSGEAFIRQRLHGMYYFKEKFGIMPEVAWMMDSFGYGRNLPQIFKKSGAKYFWTTKITWNRNTVFPFVNFWWQSPDGTRIICHECQQGDGTLKNFWLYEIGRHPLKKGIEYIGDYTRNYDDIADHVEDEEFLKTIGYWYGKGDGGHGPTSQEVCEMLEYQKNGAMRIGTAKEFFSILEKASDRFPVWNDELYLEYHRGTFTTHSKVKRNNRWLECRSVAVEMACSLVHAISDDFTYPKDLLDKSWKTILKNQFHDALPGSSIPEAYDDLQEDWEYCNQVLDECENMLAKTLKFKDTSMIVTFNPNSGGKTRLFIPVSSVPGVSLDANGLPPRAAIRRTGDENIIAPMQPVAAEPEEWIEARPAGWWTVVDLDGISLNSLEVIIGDDASIEKLFSGAREITVEVSDESFLDNGIIRVELDSLGFMKKITSKLIPSVGNILKGPSNVPVAFLDDFPNDQAWNLRPDYNDHPRDYKLDENVKIHVSKKGPVVSEITIERAFGPQQVIQKISLFKDMPEVYCEFLTDWKQETTLVKIKFDTATDSTWVESDNQYCIITRSTRPQTPADKARYEKIQHKFSDLHSADKSWGVAFLNNGKYAFDANEGMFRLTVLKCAHYPKPAAESWANIERKMNLEKYGTKPPDLTDIGPHRTFYAIYPHPGVTRVDASGKPTTDVKQAADKFNFPVLMFSPAKNNVEPSNDNDLARVINNEMITSSNPLILIKSIKRGHLDADAIVVRLVEYSGNDNETTLTINSPLASKIKSIVETDLLERPISEDLLKKSDDKVSVDVNIGKWEIKSFMLYLA